MVQQRWLWLLLVMCLMIFPVQAQLSPAPTYFNVSYTPSNAQNRHILDIYLPEDRGDDPLPTLFVIHGGGYVFGDKLVTQGFNQHFAELGYAVVAPNYRLAPRHTFPTQLEDLFCALAWTHQHAADYGFDTTRLALVGESAGANAAALIAAIDDPSHYLTDCPYQLPDSDWVQAVVAYYLFADLSTCECNEARFAAALYLGVSPADMDDPAVWGEASPLNWLNGNEPPFLLIHGVNDRIVEQSETLAFAQALDNWRVPYDLLLVEAREHAFISDFDDPAGIEAAAAAAAFLARVLD